MHYKYWIFMYIVFTLYIFAWASAWGCKGCTCTPVELMTSYVVCKQNVHKALLWPPALALIALQFTIKCPILAKLAFCTTLRFCVNTGGMQLKIICWDECWKKQCSAFSRLVAWYGVHLLWFSYVHVHTWLSNNVQSTYNWPSGRCPSITQWWLTAIIRILDSD